jgi:hypothetical protein
LWVFVIWGMLGIPVAVCAEEGKQDAGKEEELPVEVDVEKIQTRINPDIELTVPNGRFHLLFDEKFQKLRTIFNLNYEFLANSLDGSLRFSRPIGVLDPGVRFYDGIDFENYLSPSLVNGDVVLLPREEYIQRDKGVELDVRLPLATPKGEKARFAGQGLFVKGAFGVSDTFRGNLDKGEIIDKGRDLILLGDLYYRGVSHKQTPLGAIPGGTYASSLLKMRYRSDFQEPVALDNIIQLVHYNTFTGELSFTGNANLSYPVAVWRDDLATFYTLGGYDTVRGYPKNSIGAFRFLLLSTDLELTLKKRINADVTESLPLDIRLTQVRLLFLTDGLLSQNKLNIHSPVYGYVNVGSGVSLVFVEDNKRYYTLRIYVAQALLQRMEPMFYISISSSRFKIHEAVKP